MALHESDRVRLYAQLRQLGLQPYGVILQNLPVESLYWRITAGDFTVQEAYRLSILKRAIHAGIYSEGVA